MTEQSPVAKTRRRSRTRAGWAASLFALTGCTPAGFLTGLDGLSSGVESTRVGTGLAYGSDPRQRVDVWAPRSRSAEALPVVIFFYGGGWNDGSRGDYGFAGAAYAGQGFIAVVPDYRLVPAVRFPAFGEDGALAVKWARDNANGSAAIPSGSRSQAIRRGLTMRRC